MADMPAGPAPQADLKKLKSLLCPKGCGKLFLFANSTTPNTATVTDGAGASKIAYSPGFVKSVQTNYGPAGTLGIFAHDLGHHLEATGNRPAWMQSSWDSEARADAWAGCAMAKAELKPSALQAVLLVLSEYPSAKHPAWSARRPVITEGYKACGGRMLPPLAKEAAEQGATTTASAGKDDGASPARPRRGCTGDKDCRRGRMCVNSRCARGARTPPLRQGHGLPRSSGVRRGRRLRAPRQPGGGRGAGGGEGRGADAGVGVLQTQRPATAAPAANDSAACLKTCDEVRNLCVDAATSEGNKCLMSIQSDPGYRSCTCASYPNVSRECHAFCTSAVERGKGCSTAGLVQRLPRRRRPLPLALQVARAHLKSSAAPSAGAAPVVEATAARAPQDDERERRREDGRQRDHREMRLRCAGRSTAPPPPPSPRRRTRRPRSPGALARRASGARATAEPRPAARRTRPSPT